MKHQIRGVVCAIALLFAGFAAAETKQINLATVNYPPYYGNSLPEGGPLTEIIIEAFKQQGYKVSIKEMPWSRALKSAKEGSFDGIYTAWYRKEREEFFIFSDPLPENELVFFIRKGEDIQFDSYESLKPYRIGVVRDYARPEGLEGSEFKIRLGNSDKQNLDKLLAERIDMVLIDRAQGKYIIRTQIPHGIDKLVAIEPPIGIETNHLMFSRAAGSAEEKAMHFNSGLKTITESGLLQSIIDKHDL